MNNNIDNNKMIDPHGQLSETSKCLNDATTALSLMLKKISGQVLISEKTDPHYYATMSSTAIDLANAIRMLQLSKPVGVVGDNLDLECDGNCDDCHYECDLKD